MSTPTTQTPNAQTPGPLALHQRHKGFSGHTVAVMDAQSCSVYREQIGCYVPEAITRHVATARLLAASYTMADAAGRKLGVDAAELCKGLDLASLIRAAQDAASLLDSLADGPLPAKVGKLSAPLAARQLRAALPPVFPEPARQP